MSKILVTGFEPYGNVPINPAEQVAHALDGKEISGAEVVSRIVPNSFYLCIEFVQAVIREIEPEAVVMLGEFTGRAVVTVERIAQNLNDGTRYDLLDNAGYAMQDEMTVPGGPAAYYATLPIRAMVQAMRDGGVPADISDTAATFCCNHLMYGTLHHIAVEERPIRAGWIHLPALPQVVARDENLGLPSMSVETAAAGVAAGIAAIKANRQDISAPIASRLQI